MIVYYERYVVIQPGIAKGLEGEELQVMDFLTEEEYLDIMETLPIENQYLDDSDPNKFIAKMGAECLEELLKRIDLDELSYDLRHKAHNETSKQRRTEALKRLQVIESLRESNEGNKINRPEWMILKVIPVIPPELRPLVPLDGGRFATSDLNDLYRRVIIRNNRLKRLMEIKAPEVILRNEKRMLQESVDSLLDNTRKSSAVKADGNRPLKSLSDSLKGKQGRFRQNLLGKRVDYSARSVIVVGPDLELHECGLPKDMAAELYKPFIVRKLIERGVVKTVKSAKKIIDRKEPVVWDILENVLKGHPVLLNRAPTLHRLGIQAFQPKLIEGKAIRLHPLACTAFNADFDGDQMAVHLPLGPEAILEAQLLMLGSQNILNPANGSPIAVPSQDMVLGLYYMTKIRKSDENYKVKGEGLIFYDEDEVRIAYNEKAVDLNASIKVRASVKEGGELVTKLIETSVGRVLFNRIVPENIGFINEVLTKKSLRNVIGKILKETDFPTTAAFLDRMKTLGYTNAFEGGLSFSLGDILIPDQKTEMIQDAITQVDAIRGNYNMGLITNNERYNQVIDVWTNTNASLTELVMKRMREDQQGFNSVYMMLDSGARGSKEQIRQLSGMRGLMAKPQKAGSSGGDIIENPIISNFREGLSILEYFISTHGARKGLADTALKTADAGYLTRRLVDVSQDIIINEDDCGALRGLEITALKKNDEIVEPLRDRILGRTSLNNVYHPETDEVLVEADQIITEDIAEAIQAADLDMIEVRSPLTCDSKSGICAKCYGRNLATNQAAQLGETVGVVAAQSIGEPGTQLTLRTFHVGGTAGNVSEESTLKAKQSGRVEFDELKTVRSENEVGEAVDIVISRTTELKLLNKRGEVVMTNNIAYGSVLHVANGQEVKKDQKITTWDPYNAIIIAETAGKIEFENIEQGSTFQLEVDEQTGFTEKVISESRNKKLIPTLKVISKDGEEKSYNLPVGAHLIVEDGEEIKAGKTLVKIPRKSAKAGDITGGLPRVTELFEARNPSNPAVVSEIDGLVSFGKIKRGNREIIVESRSGEIKKYLIKLSNQILVQENDYIKAGMPLSEGAITPTDILSIKGPTAVQEYLVNEIQEVYRLQGVKIDDKHFEIIVRQMMRKVRIIDAGDTRFLDSSLEHKIDFIEENDRIFGMKVVEDAGDSEVLKPGQILTVRELRDENSKLRRDDKNLVVARDAMPATAEPILQGITRAALQTKSFISAASFQETTKVLNEAAVAGKVDDLNGLKENVIVGHLIPAGTGLKEYQNIIVGSKKEYQEMTGEESEKNTVTQ